MEEGYLPGWGRLMKKLEGYFNSRWGKSWKKSEESFGKSLMKGLLLKRIRRPWTRKLEGDRSS